MFGPVTVSLLALGIASRVQGTVLWSGSFDSYPDAAAFDNWSWANQTGEYQWYIHGTQPTSHYLDVSADYKNPADTSEARGLKLTIDNTAKWNSDMWRTELIPQTSTNIGTGTLFYHFSVKHSATNPPNSAFEHQIVFFESHFTELKYGVSPSATNLQWMVGGVSKWSPPSFDADTWYNFAYEIDFSGSTVGLWASTGADELAQVVAPVSGSPSTNSADFHLGVLRLGDGSDTEDWYFSGVYVESGSITTAIGIPSA